MIFFFLKFPSFLKELEVRFLNHLFRWASLQELFGVKFFSIRKKEKKGVPLATFEQMTLWSLESDGLCSDIEERVKNSSHLIKSLSFVRLNFISDFSCYFIFLFILFILLYVQIFITHKKNPWKYLKVYIRISYQILEIEWYHYNYF